MLIQILWAPPRCDVHSRVAMPSYYHQPLLQSTDAAEERREATDGALYTHSEFTTYYGTEAGSQFWNERRATAVCADAATDQPLLQSTDAAEERREAIDGPLYTHGQFTIHHGTEAGSQFWSERGTPVDVATDQPLLQRTAVQRLDATVLTESSLPA